MNEDKLNRYLRMNEELHRTAEASRRWLAVASGLNLALILYTLWLTGGSVQ